MVTDTSIKAYHEIRQDGTLTGQQKAIYNLIKSVGPVTNKELTLFCTIEINAITARVFELRKKGLVVPDIKRPCNATGRLAQSWDIVK